jgi:hypothetical protein
MKRKAAVLSTNNREPDFQDFAEALEAMLPDSEALDLLQKMVNAYEELDWINTELNRDLDETEKALAMQASVVDGIHTTYQMTTTGFRDQSDLAAVIIQAVA